MRHRLRPSTHAHPKATIFTTFPSRPDAHVRSRNLSVHKKDWRSALPARNAFREERLFGPGGIGKTTVAPGPADHCTKLRHPTRTAVRLFFLVDLASITDPLLIIRHGRFRASDSPNRIAGSSTKHPDIIRIPEATSICLIVLDT